MREISGFFDVSESNKCAFYFEIEGSFYVKTKQKLNGFIEKFSPFNFLILVRSVYDKIRKYLTV